MYTEVLHFLGVFFFFFKENKYLLIAFTILRLQFTSDFGIVFRRRLHAE